MGDKAYGVRGAHCRGHGDDAACEALGVAGLWEGGVGNCI